LRAPGRPALDAELPAVAGGQLAADEFGHVGVEQLRASGSSSAGSVGPAVSSSSSSHSPRPSRMRGTSGDPPAPVRGRRLFTGSCAAMEARTASACGRSSTAQVMPATHAKCWAIFGCLRVRPSRTEALNSSLRLVRLCRG
jgi:hypothetical protein